MLKTTLYLPEDLKTAISRVAAERATSEAELIREALWEKVRREPSRPLVPLFEEGLGDPTVAERVDDLLAGLGSRSQSTLAIAHATSLNGVASTDATSWERQRPAGSPPISPRRAKRMVPEAGCMLWRRNEHAGQP